MSNDHEWLNLIEVSGPFLAVPVLRDVFPQGLEALPSGRPQRLRRTYEEWRDAVDMDDLDLPALHAAWVDEVLVSALEMDSGLLRRNATLPDRLTISMPEHGVTITPDLAVVNPTNADEPLLLIHVYEPDTDLDATRRFDGLAITPADRMVALLRATGCPIGIVTNGERWMLVHAPAGTVAGFASWYARLWGQEPETLRAFVSLLGVRRLFGPDVEKLPALFERSLKHQDDVTEALGEQVRRAVEVLVQALDRADQDRNRDLLRDVDPRELYEAGLTVMMRLVFLLAAEERGLLLLGDPRYDTFYAISSLRMQLRADSEEILERRRSAWSRLLALFRGVYGGIDHPTLRLPALGGSLFDPDRFPFLEGRKKGTSWRSDPAEPLPIDDRTVLLLMEAIQTFEGRTLSYRALDVEQIGHVYEGLLERTVKRVDDVTLELDSGAKAKSPRVTLGEMESARLDGTARVAELLKERSERSESAIRNALERTSDDRLAARLLTVCRGDIGLRDRILRYAPVLRTDPWGYPLVHHKGAFVVVLGADRRESGTHYTPKSLTEKIVEETLTPVAYRGPAEGKAPEEWELKSAEQLLDLKICDPAMGSGAFLVQACRWLSDRLIEAWSVTEASGKRIDSEGRRLDEGDGAGFEPLSQDAEERAILARRLIAERCLYGVDRNPLAVELAKLSLWLTTMSKGRPFGFLDHNLRSGDSLLGVHDLGQLVELDMNPKGKAQLRLFGRTIRSAVDKALELRARLREIPIRDIKDVEAMAALDAQSRGELALPTLIADAFVGIILAEERAGERAARIETLAAFADAAASGDASAKHRLLREATTDLSKDVPDGAARTPFNWPLEFPEVFLRENGGFHAFVGNPPFLGGKRISTVMGPIFNVWLVNVHDGASKNADLVSHFFRRAWALIREDGGFGLLATNTIAEGDTRQSGLEWMLQKGAVIHAAYPNEPWPGQAAVVTSRVHIHKGNWLGPRTLLGRPKAHISAFLTEGEEWSPKRLKANERMAFIGSFLNGIGFVLSSAEAAEMIAADSKNEEVLFPYLGGEDLNQNPGQKPTRYVINFFDWSEEKAKEYQLPYARVLERVKPHRDKVSDTKKRVKECWWNYEALGYELYCELGLGRRFARPITNGRDRPPERVIGLSRVSKTLAFSFVDPTCVFSEQVVVFPTESAGVFSVLQSNIHAVFAWQNSSRMKNDLRYSPTDALATFPFPALTNSLESLGTDLDGARRELMIREGIGLTKLYGRYHSQADSSKETIRLRDIQREIDHALAAAFGWGDLDLGHGFHEVPYLPENDRIRFTISEPARLEVLRRLAELNRQRYQEEVDQDLHDGTSGSGKARARRSRTVSASEPTLDLEDFLPAIIEWGN
ncbi:Eco57I restriction-modification methylase domain-containing protein [Sinorhizobium meliloti]